MEKRAMQILDSAFNTLTLMMISANDAEKMVKVKSELRQAYAILERLDRQATHVPAEPPAKAPDEESEVADG
nr:MAG TPA: hypothetical protein [Bacteriophage sp.]